MSVYLTLATQSIASCTGDIFSFTYPLSACSDSSCNFSSDITGNDSALIQGTYYGVSGPRVCDGQAHDATTRSSDSGTIVQIGEYVCGSSEIDLNTVFPCNYAQTADLSDANRNCDILFYRAEDPTPCTQMTACNSDSTVCSSWDGSIYTCDALVHQLSNTAYICDCNQALVNTPTNTSIFPNGNPLSGGCGLQAAVPSAGQESPAKASIVPTSISISSSSLTGASSTALSSSATASSSSSASSSASSDTQTASSTSSTPLSSSLSDTSSLSLAEPSASEQLFSSTDVSSNAGPLMTQSTSATSSAGADSAGDGSSSTRDQDTSSTSLSTGGIIGVVVGGLVALILLVLLGWLCLRHRRADPSVSRRYASIPEQGESTFRPDAPTANQDLPASSMPALPPAAVADGAGFHRRRRLSSGSILADQLTFAQSNPVTSPLPPGAAPAPTASTGRDTSAVDDAAGSVRPHTEHTSSSNATSRPHGPASASRHWRE